MKCSQKIDTLKTKIKNISGDPAEMLSDFYFAITAAIIALSSATLFYSIHFDLSGRKNTVFVPEPIIKLSSLDEFIGIGSLVFIIWTFSTGLIVTFLGGINDKRYGIRIIDLVLAGKCAFLKLIVLSVLFLLELFVLFDAILLKKEITLMICLGMQIFWMIYFFLMICIETSEKMIQRRVIEDTLRRVRKSGSVGPLLYKMIRNLEYEDSVEMEKFFRILERIETQYEYIEKSSSKNDQLIREFSGVLTECMLKKADDKRKAFGILGSWLMLDGGYINIKRGILKGLLDNAYEPFCPDISEILDINFQGKREVVIWAAAYNFFYADKKIGQGYRTILSDLLLTSLNPSLNENDLSELFQMWREFSEMENQNSELLDLNLEALWRLMREGRK